TLCGPWLRSHVARQRSHARAHPRPRLRRRRPRRVAGSSRNLCGHRADAGRVLRPPSHGLRHQLHPLTLRDESVAKIRLPHILRRVSMPSLFLIVVIGLLGGIAIGLEAPLSSTISQRLGALESIFIVHLGGVLAAGIALLFTGGGRLGQWHVVPPVALLAGLLGVMVVGST